MLICINIFICRHHQKGSSNYAKFFTWLDYFWGSLEVPDLNDTSDKKIH